MYIYLSIMQHICKIGNRSPCALNNFGVCVIDWIWDMEILRFWLKYMPIWCGSVLILALSIQWCLDQKCWVHKLGIYIITHQCYTLPLQLTSISAVKLIDGVIFIWMWILQFYSDDIRNQHDQIELFFDGTSKFGVHANAYH